MQIRVDNIPDGGRAISVGLEESWAHGAASEALDAKATTLAITFQIGEPSKAKRVEVRLEGEAHAPATCDRCGESVNRVVTVDTTLAYQPDEREPGEPEIELEEDDLDTGWYRDGNLLLSDILTEALALALPSRTLCEDSAACDARTEALLSAASEGSVGHPAFAALKKFSN